MASNNLNQIERLDSVQTIMSDLYVYLLIKNPTLIEKYLLSQHICQACGQALLVEKTSPDPQEN